MTDIDSRLFDFMKRYYGRTQLENENDYQLMVSIFKEVFPYETVQENCTGCRGTLLKKLQTHYEVLCAKGTFD